MEKVEMSFHLTIETKSNVITFDLRFLLLFFFSFPFFLFLYFHFFFLFLFPFSHLRSPQVINIVDCHQLVKTEFSKKEYLGYIKQYMGRLKEHLEKNNPERVKGFMTVYFLYYYVLLFGKSPTCCLF